MFHKSVGVCAFHSCRPCMMFYIDMKFMSPSRSMLFLSVVAMLSISVLKYYIGRFLLYLAVCYQLLLVVTNVLFGFVSNVSFKVPNIF